MSKKEKTEITFEIVKELGYLSEKKDKILAEISWNGNPAKTEIRKCYTGKDGKLRLSNGIGLTEEECDTFVKLFEESKASRPIAVVFDEIFAMAPNIMDKRQQGFATVDGFIVLKHRPRFNIQKWKNRQA